MELSVMEERNVHLLRLVSPIVLTILTESVIIVNKPACKAIY